MLAIAIGLSLLQTPISAPPAQASSQRWGYRVNFQSEFAPVPPNHLRDFGEPYGPRLGVGQGVGLSYGWTSAATGAPFDLVGRGRERGAHPDPRLDTLMHTAPAGGSTVPSALWEFELPNADYVVRVTCGDPSFFDSEHRVVVEGLVAIPGYAPTPQEPFVTAQVTVAVTDGRLTLDANGGLNTKVNLVEITRGRRARPQVSAITPQDGSVDVALDAFIATDIYLPRGGLDPQTVDIHSIRLVPASTPGSIVQAVVNTTGGGDAIVLDPVGDLEPQTDYVFEITDDVRDIAGRRFVPFTSTFRTVSNSVGQIVDLEFERETVATGAQYTSLEIGPDRKLYALVDDGAIHRFTIEPDGTLSGQETIFSLIAAEGGPRLAIGLTHDPASTAQAPIVWVSHSTFGFQNMPDWGGAISRLTGPSLDVVESIVEELPRSARDHVTNSLAFGPDGALYFSQGGNNAMGAPDTTWANREERLLSAALLRLDPALLGALPLNVRTAEGGTYDPFAPGAPLTVHATGIRNGYDLVWHSNGSLYVPGNSSASGGNAPWTPTPLPGSCANRIDGVYTRPLVQGINGVSQTLDDFLMRIEPGGYYGHPNPSRCEWVLNGGNPTAFADPLEIPQYPVGTLPDRNFRGYAFNFGNNRSPNGAIEYRSDRFGGSLRGSLLVARYSGGDDLIVLRPSADGSIAADLPSVDTFDSFVDPLDVIEDRENGNLYVSEYGSAELTLLRPVDGRIVGVEFDRDELIANAVRGTAADPVPLIATNATAQPLRIESIEIAGSNASDFRFSAAPALPLDVPTGASAAFEVEFAPAFRNVGSLDAIARFVTDRGTAEVGLFGLSAATFEGAGEPPLARVVETLGLSIDVGGDQLSLGTNPAPLGEEVIVPRFVKAGPGPVTLTPVARYSPDSSLPFGYFTVTGGTPTLHTVGTLADSSVSAQHQQLFPELASGGTSFDPGTAPFGCFTTSPTHTSFSDDALNLQVSPGFAEHATRIFPFVDRRGFPHPDVWLIGFEEATNGDYQDYVFVLRNARIAP